MHVDEVGEQNATRNMPCMMHEKQNWISSRGVGSVCYLVVVNQNKSLLLNRERSSAGPKAPVPPIAHHDYDEDSLVSCVARDAGLRR